VEQEERGLGLLDPVDKARELVWLVLRPVQGQGQDLQVKLFGDQGGCDYVLDLVRRGVNTPEPDLYTTI
jgi:hypothetical protein